MPRQADMEKKAVVLLAEGFEEVEAVTPVDYLRRAGISVTVAALGESLAVKGARGISVNADITLNDFAAKQNAAGILPDAIVIPGGMPGAANIAASKAAAKLIGEMAAAGKLVCAICASPALVLAPMGLLSGRKFTCYPGMEENVSGGQWTAESVAVDGNIVTSRGAGTAGLFSATVIACLLGKTEGDKIAKSVLL